MKKFRLITVLLLCLALSACGTNADTTSNPAPSDTASETLTGENIISETSVTNTDTLDETASDPIQENERDDSVQEPTPVYFESDETVDNFFVAYNTIAEIVFPAEAIEKGNIRTKALIYIDDLNLEIINANDFLSISMSSSTENENTKLYSIFRDSILAMNTHISEDEIQTCWQTIHESSYMVEDYDFNGINVTYVPSKELSWGTSALRIDLEIPLE